MRILMVIPYFASTYGGTSKVVRELASSLAHIQGVEVDIITTNANNGKLAPVELNQWKVLAAGCRICYFSSWHRQDFIMSLDILLWFIRHSRKYDLIHTHTIFSPLISLIGWLCKVMAIPYVVTPHGMLEPWALEYKAPKKRLYFNIIEKNHIEQASAIQSISLIEEANIQKLGFQSVRLISNGLHPKQYTNQPALDPFYTQFPSLRNKCLLLFLGRIDPKKGLDLLAPAFATVHHKFPGCHLVLAGPDSIGFQPTAEKYFEESGCLEAVTFTGMLTGDFKQSALAAADLYVAPSYSEGFSMSVLEAMASGLPCIITTGCNFPEAAAAHAAKVVPIDSQAIADALIDCLSDLPAAKAMGNRARQFILNSYTWDHAAAKLSKLYADILKDKAQSKWH